MTAQASVETRSSSRADTGGGWYGWVVFASVMMMLLGFFHAMAGLVALFRDDYFLVTKNGLVVTADYSTWGWVHLILGALVAAAGAAVLIGQTWARAVAVIVAMTSAVVNLAFLSAYPLWATIMIAVDVMVIYAVTANRQSYEEWT